MHKIGFIGCGNMGQAILKGLIKNENYKNEDIYIYDHHFKQSDINYHFCASEKEVAINCDYIFLAIKPHHFKNLAILIKEECKGKVIISLAAGHTLASLLEMFNNQQAIIRLMPNTAVAVNAGMSALVLNEYTSKEDQIFVEEFAKSFGNVKVIAEELIDAVIGVSGSAIAYMYVLMEAMADGAVKEGMKREMAYEFAANTMYGAAKMVLKTNRHPASLKDDVCSPGGTTIEGILALEEYGFRNAILKAMGACSEKLRKMSK